MTELYRFVAVRTAVDAAAFSFTLATGELRLWQLASRAEKELLLDWAMGETPCANGEIEIVQGDRRGIQTQKFPAEKERRHTQKTPPLLWHSVQLARAGRLGWVSANGGLISNLKVWENITLPLWFHAPFTLAETEQRVAYWLTMLGADPLKSADFMASPPAILEPWQRKLTGLLRALVQMPRVLVVDAGLFEDVKASKTARWIAALENFAQQGRAVLVLADKATLLPWQKIE